MADYLLFLGKRRSPNVGLSLSGRQWVGISCTLVYLSTVRSMGPGWAMSRTNLGVKHGQAARVSHSISRAKQLSRNLAKKVGRPSLSGVSSSSRTHHPRKPDEFSHNPFLSQAPTFHQFDNCSRIAIHDIEETHPQPHLNQLAMSYNPYNQGPGAEAGHGYGQPVSVLPV